MVLKHGARSLTKLRRKKMKSKKIMKKKKLPLKVKQESDERRKLC